MKLDTSGLNLTLLRDHLNKKYGKGIGTIVFMPGGEDSYNFLGTSCSGEKLVARLQPNVKGRDLEKSLCLASVLRRQSDLQLIVSALPTLTGTLTDSIECFQIALFPFIEGHTAHLRPVDDHIMSKLGSLLATIHSHTQLIQGLAPPVETFGNPFQQTLLKAINWAHSPSQPSNRCQQDAKKLIRSEADELTGFIERFDNLGNGVRALSSQFVVTHGDPNLDNVIVSHDETLHLIDWGAIGCGPRERDLSSYSANRLETILTGYYETEQSFILHPDLFQFYQYRWCLQEIADYTQRLISGTTSSVEADYALAELQAYLPLPHNEFAELDRRTTTLLQAIQS